MGKGAETDTTQTQNQQSQTNPWAPAIPGITNLINQATGLPTSVSPGQSSALQQLMQSAGSLPNFGQQGSDAISKLFSSSTAPQQNTLSNAYSTLQSNLQGIANPATLDPYSTPGFSDAIKTMTGDITNQVKGVYAGSGRDPSGAGSFAQSLGRGLTQGIAPTIASQFNSNVSNLQGANNALFNAGNTTAMGGAQLGQIPLTNSLQALQGAGAIPGLFTSPAQAQLGAANTSQSLPFQNIAQALGLLTPTAALGSSTTGSGTSTGQTTQQQSLLSSILGSVLGGTGALGATGAFPSSGGGAGWLSSLFAMSDRNLKKDIVRIGATEDDLPIYLFRYKGDETPRLGLMAQDVEKRDPGAVIETPIGKAVNYPRALKSAMAIPSWREAA